MKQISKAQLKTPSGLQMAKDERKIMEMNNHPFITKLHYAFQNKESLYYVIDFADGGELFTILAHKGRFSQRVVQLYAAEIVLALEHLHENNILYNDLKLENLLVDSEGHILLTDFGLSQIDREEYHICGTKQYMAPEAILKRTITKAVDWWALVG